MNLISTTDKFIFGLDDSMKVTVFDINSGRPWGKWLGIDAVRDAGIEEFQDPALYQGEGRFLALIHLGALLRDGEAEKVAYFDRCGEDLPESCRHRVWWLFYSGAGYSDLHASTSNVHYLRYLVDTEVMYPEDEACFRRFLAQLGSAEDVGDGKLWDELYPEGNHSSSTLLALLSVTAHVSDADRVIDYVLAERRSLVSAHREYSARASEHGVRSTATIEEWIAKLSARKYDEVRLQLEGVLGHVPD